MSPGASNYPNDFKRTFFCKNYSLKSWNIYFSKTSKITAIALIKNVQEQIILFK